MSQKRLIPEEKEQEIINKLTGTGKRPLFQYWEEYVNDYIAAKRKKSTIANVYAAVRFFLLYSELISIEDWLKPTRVKAEFQRLAKERNWSEGTHNSYRKNISSYFSHLRGMEYIPDKSPIIRVVKAMPNLVKDQPYMSTSEIKKLFKFLDTTPYGINHMQQFRNELFFSLLLLTGARPQELLNMNLNSFSGNRDKIVIKTGKGSGKTRQYPLDYKIQKLVSMYILEVAKSGHDKELNHSFFLSVRNGAPWSYTGMLKLCQTISKETNMAITPYKFRRYVATELLAQGILLQDAQLYMGHTRPSTTMRYVQGNSSTNKKGAAILSGIRNNEEDSIDELDDN